MGGGKEWVSGRNWGLEGINEEERGERGTRGKWLKPRHLYPTLLPNLVLFH